jgi:hypothetical protein
MMRISGEREDAKSTTRAACGVLLFELGSKQRQELMKYVRNLSCRHKLRLRSACGMCIVLCPADLSAVLETLMSVKIRALAATQQLNNSISLPPH